MEVWLMHVCDNGMVVVKFDIIDIIQRKKFKRSKATFAVSFLWRSAKVRHCLFGPSEATRNCRPFQNLLLL